MSNISTIFNNPQGYQPQLEVILKNIADGITVQNTQGKLVFANNTALKILDYPNLDSLLKAKPSEIIDKFEIFDEDGNKLNLNNLPGRKALQGKSESGVIVGFRNKKNRSEKWAEVKATPVFDQRGKIIFVINVFRDITQKRKSEESLLELGRIVEFSEDAIYGIDLKTKITNWNHGASQLFGYQKSEVIGRKINILMPQENLKETLMLLETIQKGKTVKKTESTRRKKDGTVFPVSVTISPIHNVKHQLIGFSFISRDITERKLLEARREEFVSIASHELKTPITTLKAFTQILKTRFKQIGDEETAYFLSKMDDEINKLTYLINGLLDVTKMRSGIIELNEDVYNFDDIVEETIEMLQKTSRKHRIVKKGFVKKYLRTDKNRLVQVITNLITNAIKYSPEATKIVIESSSSRSEVILSVKDFGMGIPKNKQDLLFERFVRIHSERKHIPGIGLGLYISAEIIKQLDGKMWFKSKLNKGSTFYFSLPLRRQSK
ncbi:PAS domain S-box protein [Candidatus Microgenomates bacterium]|nr:PAS domain S-box protein [Candidatus Microgenomates bacterium]